MLVKCINKNQLDIFSGYTMGSNLLMIQLLNVRSVPLLCILLIVDHIPVHIYRCMFMILS